MANDTPWEVVEAGEDCVIYDAHDGMIETFYGDQGKLNAKRIVACVNACDGIPTWKLERDGLPSVTEYIEIVKQRDELVAALEYYATGIWEERQFKFFDMNPYDKGVFKYSIPSRKVAVEALDRIKEK